MMYEMRNFIVQCDKCGTTATMVTRCQIGVVFYPELPDGWQEKCKPTDQPGVWKREYYCEECSA